jgi:hypothetical protein
MKLSINENIINKGDPRTSGWKNVNFTIDQLIDHIVKRGCAWSPGILSETAGGKKPAVSDIVGAVILAVDIDNSIKAHNKSTGKYDDRAKSLAEGYLPLETAISDPWLKANSLFLYETPSSTAEWNRFRIVFLMHNLISDPAFYSEVASAFIEKFGADKSCKNIDRFFFGCRNAKFVKFTDAPMSPKAFVSVMNAVGEEELVISEYKTQGRNGDLTANQIEEMLKYIDGDSLSYDEWFRVVSAIGNYFDEATAVSLIENWSPDKSVGTKYKIEHRALKPGIASVVYFAKRAGFDTKSFYNNMKPIISNKFISSGGKLVENPTLPDLPSDFIFWHEEQIGIKNPKYNLVIDKAKFIYFLNHIGFYKYWIDPSLSIFVKVDGAIIEETSPEKMFDHLHKFINELPLEISVNFTNADLWNILIKDIRYFGCREFLTSIPALSDDFILDSKDESFVFFRNACVSVGKEDAKLIDYKSLDGYIWKDQLIDHDLNLLPQEESFNTDLSIFGKLLEFICSPPNPLSPLDRKSRVPDENRLCSLLSAIGYLLHTFKDPTLTKAVVFCEERIALQDESNGRSGKGLVANAIGKLRKRIVFNGKQLDFQDRFLFQRVTVDTQILYFDDTKKGFNFENLFSIITEGLVVEGKGKKSFDIPFNKSPKILLSTNNVLSNDSGSHRARKHEIEFSDYFSADFTPFDQFNQLLFEQGWLDSSSEWDKFYSFMIYCIQYFLKNGLIDYDKKNLDERKLLDSIPEEFYEFATDYIVGLSSGNRISRREIYNQFTENNKIFGPNGKNAISQKSTTKFLSAILKFLKIDFTEERTGARGEREYFWELT